LLNFSATERKPINHVVLKTLCSHDETLLGMTTQKLYVTFVRAK